MPIELKMPALSPTMEEGTLAKWLVKEGDRVASGDIVAEIETDKAKMEFEAVDEGVVTSITVAEGTEGVKVGTVIALIQGEDEDAPVTRPAAPVQAQAAPEPAKLEAAAPAVTIPVAMAKAIGDRIAISPLARKLAEEKGVDIATLKGTGPDGRIVKADIVAAAVGAAPVAVAAPTAMATGDVAISPLARRMAEEAGVDISALKGSGPNGRIVKADIEAAAAGRAAPAAAVASATPAASAPAPASLAASEIPYEDIKLSGMRKTIARRLSQSMQEAPHIYLTVDIRLDALLALRSELNPALERKGVKLSVNDMLIKALAVALEMVPQCNVSFGGDVMRQYKRSDISVAVSIPGGLITPIVADAANKSLSAIATEMNDLATRAKDGKLQPHEFQGGTASISNMGMMGIKQFTAVINPPQAMILAVGAGEKRPYVVDDALSVATVMTCTGSFDHRAIDGADGAQLMAAFKGLVEKPLGLVA